MLRRASVAMGLLFLCGALVQWNDPDPLGWIVMYSAAALASGVAGRVRWARLAAAACGAAALGWGLRIATEMPTWVAPARMFEPMESHGGAVEMAREVWGLGIIALWMLLLALKQKVGAQKDTKSTPEGEKVS